MELGCQPFPTKNKDIFVSKTNKITTKKERKGNLITLVFLGFKMGIFLRNWCIKSDRQDGRD